MVPNCFYLRNITAFLLYISYNSKHHQYRRHHIQQDIFCPVPPAPFVKKPACTHLPDEISNNRLKQIQCRVGSIRLCKIKLQLRYKHMCYPASRALKSSQHPEHAWNGKEKAGRQIIGKARCQYHGAYSQFLKLL